MTMSGSHMVHLIQQMETEKSQAAASSVLDWLKGQDGFVGGRILFPSPSKPGWRVQAFYDAKIMGVDDWNPMRDKPDKNLPDGMRHVLVPKSQFSALGIR